MHVTIIDVPAINVIKYTLKYDNKVFFNFVLPQKHFYHFPKLIYNDNGPSLSDNVIYFKYLVEIGVKITGAVKILVIKGNKFGAGKKEVLRRRFTRLSLFLFIKFCSLRMRIESGRYIMGISSIFQQNQQVLSRVPNFSSFFRCRSVCRSAISCEETHTRCTKCTSYITSGYRDRSSIFLGSGKLDFLYRPLLLPLQT